MVPSPSVNCGAVELDMCSVNLGVVVPIPIQLLVKIEDRSVDVERSDPTVSCDVVAMSDKPSDDDVMMEFAANEVAFVPPLATDRVPVIFARVVVAVHVGTPLTRARVKPSVVLAIDDRVSAADV